MKRIVAVILCLSLAACNQSPVVSTLEAAVQAAIVFDEIKNPSDAPYLMLATGCLDAAESILETTATATVKAGEIGTVCAVAVAAAPGASPTAQAVAIALSVFLSAVTAEAASGNTARLKPNNPIRLKIDRLKSKARRNQ